MFGELLVQLGLVEQRHIEEALALQALSGQRIGEALVSLGHVSREQLQGALLAALGLTAANHPKPKLGELLVRLKYVTEEQLEEGLAAQREDGRRLGEILVELGYCTFKQVYEALNLQQGKRDTRRKDDAARRVAVVDDSPISLELIRAKLADHGYEVTTFSDPFSALEQIPKLDAGIVLSDLQMPGMDGPELCQRLKTVANGIPVIILTANDNEAERVSGLRAGVDDYVSKSASFEELAARMETVLRRTGETEKVRRLFARYTSDAVVEEVLKHPGDVSLAGDRREVTILFADLRNFTGLSDALPPEAVVAVLNEVLGRLADAVLTCGGTLDKFLGDGLMAVFGAPVRRDDDAVRSVQAASMMMKAVARVNEDSSEAYRQGKRKEPPPILRLGIGINTGPVVAGNIGSAVRTEYTVIGDSVNVAARLCALAEPGEVLVGQRTQELVNSPANFEELAPVMLKGKPRPVPVWRLR